MGNVTARRLVGRFWCRGSLPDGRSEWFDHVAADGDPDCELVPELVVPQFELECVEEAAPLGLGQLAQVDVDLGQLVDQIGVDALLGPRCGESSQFVHLEPAGLDDLDEPVLQAGPELVVDAVVAGRGERLELGHQVGLSPLQLVDLLTHRDDVGLVLPVVGQGPELVGEVGAPVPAEDPAREELVDQGQDLGLVDQDVGRVLGIPGRVAVVLAVGDARVVGQVMVALVPSLAEHPPRTQVAEDVRPQRVATRRLRVTPVGTCGRA